MKSRLFLGTALLLALFACNKNTDTKPVPEPESPNYFPLSTGSYWVYNIYQIDSLGNEELISENDTTQIIGDTVINGNTYKKFYGNRYHTHTKEQWYYRDSAEFVVNNQGSIVFSQTNFTDTLSTNLIPDDSTAFLFTYIKMEIFSSDVILPSGVFDSLLNSALYVDYLHYNGKLIAKNDHLFAPNVGKILRQYFYSAQYENKKSYFEERLVSYYIAH